MYTVIKEVLGDDTMYATVLKDGVPVLLTMWMGETDLVLIEMAIDGVKVA